jgi:hypothetical protein
LEGGERRSQVYEWERECVGVGEGRMAIADLEDARKMKSLIPTGMMKTIYIYYKKI